VIGVALVVFVIADGVTRMNLAPEGALGRGALVTALVVAWLAWLARSGLRLELPAAVMVGVLAAYSISESYHTVSGVGLGTLLVYTGAYWGQMRLRRDWLPDLALAGLVLAGLVLVAAPAGRPAGGMLNRNMVAGALIALFPAAWVRFGQGRRLAVIVARVALAGAVLVSGSRGAAVGMGLAALGLYGAQMLAIVARPRAKALAWLSAPGGVAALAGLVAIRPATVLVRVEWARRVLAHWWATSPVFGLGPIFRAPLDVSIGSLASDAHSLPLSLLVSAGLAGASVIGLSLAATWSRRWPRYAPWKLATLGAVGVGALFEASHTWWPVGLVAALVLASPEATHA